MKKIIVIASILLLLNTPIYAKQIPSCDQDVIEMMDAVIKSGYIWTKNNGLIFTSVRSNPLPKGENSCTTEGDFSSWYVCTLIWDKGNWDDTLRSEDCIYNP